jgi:hypothetical protein
VRKNGGSPRPPREKIPVENHDAVGNARQRVHEALPYWTRWPRKLRRIYALLEQFGASDASIKEICNEFGWDHTETSKLVEEEPGFKEALHQFRETGRFAKKPNWKKYLSRDQIEIVLADEDSLALLFHVQDAKAEGKAGVEYALKRIEARGYLDNQRSIAQEPQQILDRQEKVAGVPVTAEENLAIRYAGTASGLGFEIPEEDEDASIVQTSS